MKSIRRAPLVAFFALAFLITWSFQLGAIYLAQSQAMTLSNETNYLYFLDLFAGRLSYNSALILILFLTGAGPLIAALIVTWATDGKRGLRHLWRQSLHWRIAPKWYLIAFALPLLLSVVSLGLGLLASDGQITYVPKLRIDHFIPFFLFMVVFTGITEEPGWRGFALPRLQHHFSALKSSWILGPLWGVWHFPFIIYYNYGQGIAPLVVSFILLTLGIVGWTIVNTWLYNSTRSVWLMILLHGWGNAVQSFLVLSSGNVVAQSVYGMLPWLIAFVLLRVYGGEHLAAHPRPQIAPPNTIKPASKSPIKSTARSRAQPPNARKKAK